MPALRSTWPVLDGAREVGIVTSTAYSPRLETNIAFATVETAYDVTGRTLGVLVDGEHNAREAIVVQGFGQIPEPAAVAR